MKHVFLAMILFLATACPALAAQPKMAVVVPLTGPLAYLGKDIHHAVELAVKEINENGGLLGQKITLDAFDNKSDLGENVLVARKVVQGQYDCVIGPVVSSRALAAAREFQKAGIPMISPGASAAEVTQVGDYIFRSNFTNDFLGRIMAHFVYRQLQGRRVAVLTQSDEVYSVSLTNAFSQGLENLGGKIIFRGQYQTGQTGFQEELKTIKEDKADVLLIPGYDREAALIIEQARGMGIDVPIVGGDAWSTNIPNLIDNPAYLDNCYEIRHFARNVATDLARTFLARFEEAYGPMNHDVGALAYDAVLAYAEAVREAGSFDRAKVKDALLRISIRGVTGTIRFNSMGDPEKSALIVTYRNGLPVYFMVMEP